MVNVCVVVFFWIDAINSQTFVSGKFFAACSSSPLLLLPFLQPPLLASSVSLVRISPAALTLVIRPLCAPIGIYSIASPSALLYWHGVPSFAPPSEFIPSAFLLYCLGLYPPLRPSGINSLCLKPPECG